MQVESFTVRRRKIDLEIAAMHDHANRGFDSQCHAIHKAMGDADRLDRKWSNSELRFRLDLDQFSVIEQLMLVQLTLDISQGELGTIDRHVQLGEYPGKAADVVFMSVGEDDRADALPVFDQVGDVGDDDVHAEQFRLGEHQPRVDHNYVVLPAYCQAVHAELAQAAERNYLQSIFCHRIF